MHERLKRLADLGQSVWFDYIRRGMFASGELQQLLDDGVVGMTSNPSIFEKAIAGSDDYEQALKELAAAGKSDVECYEALAVDDIRSAADTLAPVYESTEGRDGYVSLEVAPSLADDTANTVGEARRLWQTVDRPNLMIKVPATEAGIPAIRSLIGQGVNVNATLIFSCHMYEQVADAYIAGLEDRAGAGGNLAGVASVASFFVSRVDPFVDRQLEARIQAGDKHLEPLLGQAANANAKIAYAKFGQIFAQPRFAKLAEQGARVQRPLWASTSTKDPRYPDTIYVDNLIGPDTVNTIPPATLEAFKDHGQAERTVDVDLDEAHRLMANLAKAGIDIDQVTSQLLEEGVAAFATAFDKLMTSLRTRTTGAA